MNRCPRPDCNRAGRDVGDCGNFAMPCPPPVVVDPIKDIVLHCTRCGITRAITVSEIMKGAPKVGCQGDIEVCAAVVVREAKLPPPPRK